MRIGVLSRSRALYSTQRLITAGYQRGHIIHLIDYTECQLVIEAGRAEVLFQGDPVDFLDAVIPRIGASATQQGAALLRQFSAIDVFSVLSPEALLQSRNKFQCLQLLSLHGLPVPNTMLCYHEELMERLVVELGGFPIVLKVLEGTHGSGVLLLNDLQTAKSLVEIFHKNDQAFILQQYIAESKGVDVRAFVVGDRVVAAMERRSTTDDFRANIHRGAIGQKIDLSPSEEGMVLRATQLLGLQVAGVDFLRGKDGPLILEVNASPGLEGIEGATDVNIAGAIIHFIEKSVRNTL